MHGIIRLQSHNCLVIIVSEAFFPMLTFLYGCLVWTAALTGIYFQTPSRLIESSNRRMVECRIVDSSNGGVVESNRGMLERWSCRIVERWSDPTVELSYRRTTIFRMVEMSNCTSNGGMVELSNRRMVDWRS